MYCGIAAYAQFLGRNYDEAMRLAGDGIRQRGDFVGAHRVLTAAAGMAGQNDVAEAALQERRGPEVAPAANVEKFLIQINLSGGEVFTYPNDNNTGPQQDLLPIKQDGDDDGTI